MKAPDRKERIWQWIDQNPNNPVAEVLKALEQFARKRPVT